MSAAAPGPGTKLYTPHLLGLATSLSDYPLAGSFALRAEGRSRTCGSSIAIGLDMDDRLQVTRIGMQVAACAVGQGSAAILAGGVSGRTCEEVAAATRALEGWLGGAGSLPDWPGIDALEPARAHPGRHGALLMPWKAARDALSQDAASG